MYSWLKKARRIGYIAGRVATRKDVEFGFFSLVDDTGQEISVPYDIKIPQPVVYAKQGTRERNTGILIQAELVTQTRVKGQGRR